jgi:predicted dehydrogenase
VRSPRTASLRLHGAKGTLVDDGFRTHLPPGQADYARFPTIRPNAPEVARRPFQGALDHLIDCIRADCVPIVDLKAAVQTHEIMVAAELSAHEGRPVKLPLPR